MIALVGFPGAGKSTVGRLLAARLNLPFVDVDELIERRAGASIPALFEAHGEAGFRSLERTVAVEALRGAEGVVALGGGAVEDPDIRAALGGSTTVHLVVDIAEALERAEGGADRPMLSLRDPEALYAERRGAYARVASFSVQTERREPARVADEIVRRLSDARDEDGMDRIAVTAPSGAYEVVVGRRLIGRAGELVPIPRDAEVAFIVTQAELRGLGEPLEDAFGYRGLRVHWSLVEQGERAKSTGVAERLYDELALAGAHRTDLIVALGGGVVCDLAGYVASTYHRGMAVAHLPTSLLAQVDAAIGGKTGVNLRHGKNLVGTIHQPVAVLCDLDALATLPAAELRSGMAEVIKYGLIEDPSLLEIIETQAEEILDANPEVLRGLVARSVAIKGAIVEDDERELGRRAHLNYGHTFAHALERSVAFEGLRHGEAVALGMMAAAHLAEELGRIDKTVVDVHRRALEAVGLPVSRRCDLAGLERAWQHDKKYRRGVRFVLLAGLGRPEADISAPRESVARAIERLAE